MSDTQHTPEPWTWYWRETDGEADCGITSGANSGQAYSVARCPRYQTREQWEADAKVLVRGPVLLAENARLTAQRDALAEALKLTLATAQHFEKQASKGTGGRRGGPVFAKARAALATLEETDDQG